MFQTPKMGFSIDFFMGFVSGVQIALKIESLKSIGTTGKVRLDEDNKNVKKCHKMTSVVAPKRLKKTLLSKKHDNRLKILGLALTNQ